MENGAAAKDFDREYRKLSEKERTLPSGFVVRFRALGVGEWVSIWGSVPRLVVDESSDGSKESEKINDDILNRTQRAVVAASVYPKLYHEHPRDVSEPGTMSVMILSDKDLADYLKGISEMMGYGTKPSDEAAGALKA